uniref:Uncharacterized protein n=1 Tax=Rhizophora mucronata TaxID=61149 RepID=A0A2P2N6V5_RHIMU
MRAMRCWPLWAGAAEARVTSRLSGRPNFDDRNLFFSQTLKMVSPTFYCCNFLIIWQN